MIFFVSEIKIPLGALPLKEKKKLYLQYYLHICMFNSIVFLAGVTYIAMLKCRSRHCKFSQTRDVAKPTRILARCGVWNGTSKPKGNF